MIETAARLEALDNLQYRLLPVCCRNCAGSGCAGCDGTGLVCPVCAGGHWLRRPLLGDIGRIGMVPCVGCCIPDSETDSGMLYDGPQEVSTVVNWLDDWAVAQRIA